MEILKPIVLPTCEKEVFDKVLREGDNTFAVGIAEISITYAQEAALDVALPKEDPNELDFPELEYLKITGLIHDCGPEYVFQIETPEGPWTFDDASELVSLLNDFKSRLSAAQFETQKPNVKAKPQPKPKSLRKRPSIFTDEQKADIIRRYKAGEGPKAISESLGCSRSLITHIIRDAGVVEGRTGAHLNRKKEEPQPEADENEPV